MNCELVGYGLHDGVGYMGTNKIFNAITKVALITVKEKSARSAFLNGNWAVANEAAEVPLRKVYERIREIKVLGAESKVKFIDIDKATASTLRLRLETENCSFNELRIQIN